MAKRSKSRSAAHRRRPKPQGGGSAFQVFDGLCRDLLATHGRDLVRSGNPLQAEVWASEMLGMWSDQPLLGVADSREAIGGRFVAVARRQPGPQARACLLALAGVAESPLGRRAAQAAGAMAGGQGPAWLDDIGASRPTRAWRASDLWGDQDSVMVGFEVPGCGEHVLLALIDHPLGGIAKDAAVLEASLAHVLEGWDSGGGRMELVEEPVELAAARIVDAVDRSDHTIGAPLTDDYRGYRALLLARFGPLAGQLDGCEPMGLEERETLIRVFLSEPAGSPFAHDPAAWYLLDAMVDFRCDEHHRDPLRWSGASVELFLADWVPRKLSARDDTLARAPEVMRAWIPWAIRRAGLPADMAAESLGILSEVAGALTDAIADPARWGPAKRMAMELLAAGVDISDTRATNQWLRTGETAARPA